MAAEAPSLKAASLLTDRSGVGVRSGPDPVGRPAGVGNERTCTLVVGKAGKPPHTPVPVQKLHQRRRQSSPQPRSIGASRHLVRACARVRA
jgi:hypothetical protein